MKVFLAAVLRAAQHSPLPCLRTVNDLSPEATAAPAVAFLQQESYFCCIQAGSDVTGPSSSSVPGSSLAPQILLSFPVVLSEMEELWCQ